MDLLLVVATGVLSVSDLVGWVDLLVVQWVVEMVAQWVQTAL